MSPIVNKIPDKLLRLAARGFIKFQAREAMEEQIPKRMVLFVTNRCNLKCKHCFYIPHTSPIQEMSLSQIQKIARSAKNNLKQVVFTGGEPFLRDDFSDIVLSFAENGCKTANIITNGTLTEEVRLFLDKMLEKTKIQLVFMISFDGPPAINDSIRGVPGAAEKTLETLTLLSKYYQKHPSRFGNVFVSTSINRLNLAYLPETIKQIRPFKNIGHSFNFTRSADLHTFGVAQERLSGFNVNKEIILNANEMKNVLEYLDKEFWGKSDASLVSLINRQTMIEIIRILEQKTSNFTCLAGKTELIVYPEGDVGICEMLKSVGNLKETDYDLIKFYQRHKEKFQAKKLCRCTHDCAILSSIRFSPESLVEIVKRKRYSKP